MGTWALPQKENQAKQLEELMQNPLPASLASDRLYNLIGDDDLFDKILEEFEFDKNSDIRNLVKSSLQFFIKNNASKLWDKNALKICERICN
jgi:hypothetical protein